MLILMEIICNFAINMIVISSGRCVASSELKPDMMIDREIKTLYVEIVE
jgi:hypothetical protein